MTTLQRALLAIAALVVVVGGMGLLMVDRATQLDKAIAHLGDEDRFSTNTKAAQTVADLSTQLQVDGKECRADEENSARCAALLSAAAFTAVTAMTMLDCTAPDIYDARIALQRYLRSLRDFIDRGATAKPPALPKVIAC